MWLWVKERMCREVYKRSTFHRLTNNAMYSTHVPISRNKSELFRPAYTISMSMTLLRTPCHILNQILSLGLNEVRIVIKNRWSIFQITFMEMGIHETLFATQLHVTNACATSSANTSAEWYSMTTSMLEKSFSVPDSEQTCIWTARKRSLRAEQWTKIHKCRLIKHEYSSFYYLFLFHLILQIYHTWKSQ